MFEQNIKAIWNMDEEALKRINALLNAFAVLFNQYGKSSDKTLLEEAYWNLREIRREINAKLTKSESDFMNKKVQILENNRRLFLQGKLQAGSFYDVEEVFYMVMAKLMKMHGIFFREGDDPSKAVTRR